jgi:hypothetical protein
MILEMDHISGVQWIPGAGAPGPDHWIDIFRRIFSAGKKAQVWGDNEVILKVISEVGHGPGIHCRLPGGHVADEQRCRKELAKFGFDEGDQ